MSEENITDPAHHGRPMRRRGWIYLSFAIAILLAVAALSACADTTGDDDDAPVGADDASAAGSAADDGDAGPLNVVVTMPFLPSMVEEVGRDRVTVESIIPQGVDAHTYQPSPGDARVIADADIIFVNGMGLEEFLDDLIESAGGVDASVIELADGLQDQGIETDDHHHDDDHADDDHHADDHEDDDHHDHDHDSPYGNPHFWLSPTFGIHYVENIADALIEKDPAYEDEYRSNAHEYIAEIEDYDEWARGEIETIPDENRRLVTFHDAFPYFAEHYGLEVIGVVISSPGRDPGAQELARLADQITEVGVPAVFIEPQFNPNLAEAIADEAGVQTKLIYSDTPPEDAGYLEMMRLNVESVVEGLS